jgi:hypothetical protein
VVDGDFGSGGGFKGGLHSIAQARAYAAAGKIDLLENTIFPNGVIAGKVKGPNASTFEDKTFFPESWDRWTILANGATAANRAKAANAISASGQFFNIEVHGVKMNGRVAPDGSVQQLYPTNPQ